MTPTAVARWPQPRWLRMAALALACCGATAGAALAPPPDAAAEMTRWLTRMQAAARQRSYLGTLAITVEGAVSSSRVSQVVDGQQRYERVETLDGPRPREQIRHNDIVYTLWPRERLAVHERADVVPGFPSLPQTAQRARESYELHHQGTGRVAGREADVLLLRPRDALRFAQRLWADRETGLLLRAELLGTQGQTIESATFSDVQIGLRRAADARNGARVKLDGYRVVDPPSERADFDGEGWALAPAVPGFHPVICTRHPLELDGTAGEPMVLQSVYSDGLTQVSIFVERYDASRHVPLSTSRGAAHASMARRGDWWITIVGDVPMQTIALFEAALQRKP